MRRHRNPRYAPESLERKLNPSGLAGIPVAAEICIPDTQSDGSSLSAPVTVAINPTATTSVIVVAPYSLSTITITTVTLTAEVPTVPGSPEPVSPDAPSGGTEPAPPDGDGNPPIGLPSTPGGPVVPA